MSFCILLSTQKEAFTICDLLAWRSCKRRVKITPDLEEQHILQFYKDPTPTMGNKAIILNFGVCLFVQETQPPTSRHFIWLGLCFQKSNFHIRFLF